jgi:uncharacterized protein YndB with AHSA1/START domain
MTATQDNLQVTRFIRGQREKVYEAWTRPDLVAQWLCPTECSVVSNEAKVRVGGAYRETMKCDSELYTVFGTYKEIVPNEKLVFTHRWENSKASETVATVAFVDRSGGTEVTLRQVGFDDPANAKSHEAGWTSALENLAQFIASQSAMVEKPKKEHRWLQKFVGQWSYEIEARISPDEAPMKSTGTESVQSIGDLWILAEGKGEMPDGCAGTMIMTLGYDPRKKRYVGTWIGSMMTHLWVYDGVLDATANVLTLTSEGPSMQAEGKMAWYRDMIEFKNDDHRVLTSHFKDDNGNWHEFMSAHYRRNR